MERNTEMTQEERLKLLKNMVLGMSKLMGNDTEIVLHDLYKKELIYIVNNHITGRSAGYHMDPTVYEVIENLADSDGHLIGYGSKTAKGMNLRSSHFILRDEDGQPAAMICINQDTSRLQNARDLLDSMIRLQPLGEVAQEQEPEDETNYIQKMTQQVIIDSIEKMKPTSIDTKEGKLRVLQQLEIKGVFAVKDAVPSVCRLLSISQATLYNYLREIRSQEVPAAQSTLQL